MAADLATTPTTGIEVQLCGNAHPSNFGVFASPDRPLLFDVDEFDDTIPGPWEWDVKRLAAGLVIVGRQVGSGTDRRREMVLSALGSYRRRMRALASLREIDVWYWHMPAAAIRTFLTAAGRKGRAGCTGRPDIVGAEAEVESTFWEQASLVMRPNLAHDFPFVRDVIEEYQQTVAQQQQRFLRQATVADVALQRDGIANLGIRRFLVSLRSPEGECLVLQVSEAQASHVTRHVARNVYRNQGQRIVAGQRMIQAAEDPFLGWVRASDGNAYWIRRVPERRVAADVSTMSVRALRRYAELCGAAVACAHARSGDRIQIAAYLGKSDRFDRAIVRFAESYAEQVERDYEGLIRAARSGRIPAESYSTSPADA